MKTNFRKFPHQFVLILVLSSLLILSACENTQQPNLTAPTKTSPKAEDRPQSTSSPIPTKPPSPDMRGETFTIYAIIANDEPFTPITRSVRTALEDYTNYKNARGGVNGAELKVMFAEVDSTGAGATAAFELFSARDDALVILMLAPVTDELYQKINAQDIPVIYFGVGALPLDYSAKDDRLFWLVPTPQQQFEFWANYALINWVKIRPEGQFNVMRLNFLSWEGAYREPESLAGIRTFLQQENIVLASQGTILPLVNASASNPILDGVFNQATMIYMDLFSYGPAIVLNDLYYLDLGKFFVIAGGCWTVGIQLDKYLPSPELVEPIYTPLPIAWWSEKDNPGIQAAVKIFQDAGHDPEYQDLSYLYGLAALDLAVSALETTLLEQKNAVRINIQPDKIYEALSEFEDTSILNGLMTVNFSEGNRTPSQMRLWKFIAGEGLVLESDYLPLIDHE